MSDVDTIASRLIEAGFSPSEAVEIAKQRTAGPEATAALAAAAETANPEPFTIPSAQQWAAMDKPEFDATLAKIREQQAA